MAEFIKDKNGTAYNVQHLYKIYCNDQYCIGTSTIKTAPSVTCDKGTPCYDKLMSYHTPDKYYRPSDKL